MNHQAPKNIKPMDLQTILPYITAYIVLFIVLTFTWPVINSVVWESLEADGKSDFITDYKFFLELSWPYMFFATFAVMGIWNLLKKVAPK